MPKVRELPAIYNSDIQVVPPEVEVKHVDSSTTQSEHVDADAIIMTAQIVMLMQLWPSMQSLAEMCTLSDQLMKSLHTRRELCLKPTSKVQVKDDHEIDITPI